MDMHEGTGEVIGYLDKPLAKFLESINNKESTGIIMFSDHGHHLGGLKKNIGGV